MPLQMCFPDVANRVTSLERHLFSQLMQGTESQGIDQMLLPREKRSFMKEAVPVLLSDLPECQTKVSPTNFKHAFCNLTFSVDLEPVVADDQVSQRSRVFSLMSSRKSSRYND